MSEADGFQTIAPPTPTELNGLTWQKVILGDWTAIIRDLLDVARIAFIVATIVWISLGHAWTGLVAASLVILFGLGDQPAPLLRRERHPRHVPARLGLGARRGTDRGASTTTSSTFSPH